MTRGRPSKRPTWLTDTELERLYCEEELSQSEIGERVGVTGPTISNWMDEFGIETRHGRRPDWLTDDELQRLYCDEDMTLADIAAKVGVSIPSVSQWVCDAGIDTEYGKRPEWLTDGELHRLYWKEDMSQAAIGEYVGVDQSTVKNWMAESDIKTHPSPAEGKRPDWLTDDELERLYWDEGLSQFEISTRVDATASGVGYWMAEGDIETR